MENEVVKTNDHDLGPQIPIDAQTAYNVKILEFDKLIADAEATVIGLKQQKATFKYETTVNNIVAQHQMQQQLQQQQNPQPEIIKNDSKNLVTEMNKEENKVSEESIPQKTPAKKEK